MPHAKAMNHKIPYYMYIFLIRLALTWQKDLPLFSNEKEILTTDEDYRNASNYNSTIFIAMSTNTSHSEFNGDECIHRFPTR